MKPRADRVEAIRRALADLERRIRAAGRDPADVALVAVTKGQPAEVAAAALEAGLVDVGENYAQELLAKAAALEAAAAPLEAAPAPLEAAARSEERTAEVVASKQATALSTPRWHYLGAIQRRRVPRLAPVVACWQGLWRPEEVEALARRAPGASVFVEVELTGLPGRQGCEPADAPRLVDLARRAGLNVRGLMTMGPPDAPEAARRVFRELRRLADDLGLEECSMGTSEDLEIALEEGSTMLRVGRALFDERPSVATGRSTPSTGRGRETTTRTVPHPLDARG
jgi:uncharacterized pyridoxal phosphate-containing UPF0001 family protein